MTTLKWVSEHVDTVSISKSEKLCVNCEHFHLHYVLSGGWCVPITMGHCDYPRMKERRAYDECPHFKKGRK